MELTKCLRKRKKWRAVPGACSPSAPPPPGANAPREAGSIWKASAGKLWARPESTSFYHINWIIGSLLTGSMVCLMKTVAVIISLLGAGKVWATEELTDC